MTSILDTIDAATGALCACGCLRPLDPDGPSGWWATEDCQRSWQARGGDGAPLWWTHRNVSTSVVTVRVDELTATMDEVAGWFITFGQTLGAAVRPVVAAFQQIAAYCPEHQPEPPACPLARVGAGHTGPKVKPRAPRRINATRAR